MDAKVLFKHIRFAAMLIALAMIVAACSSSETPAPTAVSTATTAPTATLAPTTAPPVKPVIALNPLSGAPGTPITIVGTGFTPNARVSIRIAPPGSIALQPLGDTLADANGAINVVIFAPAVWPNGAPITEDRLALFAASESSSVVATAEFALQRPATATPTQPAPTATTAPQPATATPTVPAFSNWRAEYYNNASLAGAPMIVRDEVDVNFNWGTFSPATTLPADGFSARWTRSLNLQAGPYRFYARADDGVRVWLDGQLIIDEWHEAANATYSAERNLSADAHSLRVEYYESKGIASVVFWLERTGSFPQWRGEYFANASLLGQPTVVRNDVDINFNWGGGAPATGLPIDNFSARWSRTLYFDEGTYRFVTLVDDAMRLYVDGALIFDEWREGGPRETSVDVRLAAGSHNVRIEYFERGGNAVIQTRWERLNLYPDWKGEYFANSNLQGAPALTRNDVVIDFAWGNSTPAQSIPVDNFSARWTRTLDFEAATYRFRMMADDGMRLWIDNGLLIDDWRDGAAREVAIDVALARGPHSLRVEYYERVADARVRLSWEKLPASFSDWQGEYWINRDLSGAPTLIRNDKSIDFNWGSGSPAPSLPADNFSARWTRQVNFEPGTYRFFVQADDGVRLYVDGALVLYEWHDSDGSQTYIADLALSGSRRLVVEYYDGSGQARINLRWERQATPTATVTPIPSRTFTPTPTATVTVTPIPSRTFTPTPTATQPAPTETPTSTVTPIPTRTFTPTPTTTATPSQTPTATATQVIEPSGVVINEVLPVPGAIDWDGSGEANANDEWIELTNTRPAVLDLSGWVLSNTHSSAAYMIPAGTWIEPGQFLVFYRQTTGLALGDEGDTLRLLNPRGQVVDKVTFGALGVDRSTSRDAAGVWHSDWSPSPGAANVAPGATTPNRKTPNRRRRPGLSEVIGTPMLPTLSYSLSAFSLTRSPAPGG